VRFPRRLVDDLTHHATGFSFLTLVAALNVLGSAGGVVHGWWRLAWGCWIAAFVLWVVLLYPALVAAVVGLPKPELGQGINGTWFLLTVSTESIAALGALLLLDRGAPSEALELAVLATFTLGVVLYLIVMTMVFLRWTFLPLSAAELQPPSWIAAGAVAITVLAGSNLLAARSVSERLDRLAPFLEGTAVLAWSTATFWFPVMLAIGAWRHLVRKVPITYHPAYWALVFPIGMYGASTYRMIAVTGFEVLDPVPVAALGLGLVAWAAAFAGLLRSLAGSLGRARSARPSGG
jgi:tellurite resistance protein TehA-like permease